MCTPPFFLFLYYEIWLHATMYNDIVCIKHQIYSYDVVWCLYGYIPWLLTPYPYTHVPLHMMFYYYYQFHMIPYYHIPCHTIPYQFTCQLVQWNKKVHVRCCTLSVRLCTMIHNSVSFLFMHRLLFASDKWTKEQEGTTR